MHMSMGKDRIKLIRDALAAILRAAAFSSSVAGTTPAVMAPLMELSGCICLRPQWLAYGVRRGAALYAAGEAMVSGRAMRPATSRDGPLRAPQVEPIEFWVLGKIAHQNPVDVNVERSARSPRAEFGELLFGPCRAEIGPVVDDMQVGA